MAEGGKKRVIPSNSDCHPERSDCHPERSDCHPERSDCHPEHSDCHPERQRGIFSNVIVASPATMPSHKVPGR
jgi:hypothetical protein